jgi:muramoyltetrapeptide carboxypeptidase
MADATGPAPGALVSPRLRAGDRVRLVSPASRPEPERVRRGAQILASWGLEVEISSHAFDSFGHYLAGRDEDRLADLNDALRDPAVRAIVATTGGKGAYRIASGLDFAAARRDPKPLVGFSDITILHLALWQRCRLVGFHGPHAGWQDWYGSQAADSLRRALMQPEVLTVHRDPDVLTAKVLVEGRATGVLMGGNLDTIGRSVGWACPSFDGAVLLIEDVDKYIGAIDRTLTQLLEAGCLEGLRGWPSASSSAPPKSTPANGRSSTSCTTGSARSAFPCSEACRSGTVHTPRPSRSAPPQRSTPRHGPSPLSPACIDAIDPLIT